MTQNLIPDERSQNISSSKCKIQNIFKAESTVLFDFFSFPFRNGVNQQTHLSILRKLISVTKYQFISLQRKGKQALMTKEQKGEGKTSQKPVGKTCIKQNDLMVSEQSLCSMLLKKAPISNGLDVINVFLSSLAL